MKSNARIIVLRALFARFVSLVAALLTYAGLDCLWNGFFFFGVIYLVIGLPVLFVAYHLERALALERERL
jgi:hypothetical protein